MPRNGENSRTVGKHNMLALSCNPKSNFFQHAHGIQMVDAGELWRRLRDLDFTYVGITQQFVAHRQVVNDGVANGFVYVVAQE